MGLLSGGKVNLPGLGFGMGDVVLLELLKARAKTPKVDNNIDVYCLVENEELRPETLQVVQMMRDAGLSVEYPFTALKPEKQFKRALELGADHSIAIETGPASERQVRIKNLHSREEQKTTAAEAVRRLADRAQSTVFNPTVLPPTR